jgi:hypothetical protein
MITSYSIKEHAVPTPYSLSLEAESSAIVGWVCCDPREYQKPFGTREAYMEGFLLYRLTSEGVNGWNSIGSAEGS